MTQKEWNELQELLIPLEKYMKVEGIRIFLAGFHRKVDSMLINTECGGLAEEDAKRFKTTLSDIPLDDLLDEIRSRVAQGSHPAMG